MNLLFCSAASNGAEWLAALARALPAARVHACSRLPDDVTPPPPQGIDYALLWKPPPPPAAASRTGQGDIQPRRRRRRAGRNATPCRPACRSSASRTPAWRSRWANTSSTRCCASTASSTRMPRRSAPDVWQPLARRRQARVRRRHTRHRRAGHRGRRGAPAVRISARRLEPDAKERAPASTSFAGSAELDAFLARCQVLVCLLPLTRETRGLLDRRALSQLPRGAYLVNVARGGIVVDEDLLALLDQGRLGGATLDVFHDEPLPAAHPFWHHPRISDHAACVGGRRWSRSRWRRSPPRSAGSRPDCRSPASSTASAVTKPMRSSESHREASCRSACASSRSAPRDGLQNEKATRSDRGQGRADRPPDRRGPAGDRGDQLRVAEMGAADGRQRGGDGGDPAQARRALSGADAEHEGLRGGARRAVPTRWRCSSPRRRPSRKRTSIARSRESLERARPVAAAAKTHGVRVRGYISCVLGCPYEGEIAPSARARRRRRAARDGLLRNFARRHHRHRHAGQDAER